MRTTSNKSVDQFVGDANETVPSENLQKKYTMIFGFRNREFPSECREVEFHNDENVILACPYTNRNSNRDCADGISIMYSTIKTCDITF